MHYEMLYEFLIPSVCFIVKSYPQAMVGIWY